MVSTKFIKQTKQLELDLVHMSQVCIRGLSNCKQALFESNKAFLEDMNELHEEVSIYGRECEQLCMRILLLQHPVAKDLRRITASTNTVRDLTRIMDQEKEITELILKLEKVEQDLELHILFKMCKDMISLAMQAFVQKDMELALKVIEMDDAVDLDYSRIKRVCIEELSKIGQNTENIVDLLLIAKYIERICDHCVNVARWILYEKNGIYEE